MATETSDENGNNDTECNHYRNSSKSILQSSEQDDLPRYDNSTRYQHELERLRESGRNRRSDIDQPNLLSKPEWFNETLFNNAKSVYQRHFMGINFAHLSGLILLVRINSIYRTLSSTGKSDSVSKLFRRYYQTVVHVKKWYEGDIFEPDSEAYVSLLIVRGMHNKVSATFNDAHDKNGLGLERKDYTACMASNGHCQVDGTQQKSDNDDSNSMHISQYDIMLTQFAFIGFIATKAKSVGLIDDFNQFDFESLLHFWRVIGYYLGATDEYNLCSRKADDVVMMCNTIMDLELKSSIKENHSSTPPAKMSLDIVRSVKFIPMLTFYGITKYLFELMGLDTSELEAKSTRYSRLSYTLIKLVMSNLLAYRPFRWFNNGLTRLSVYCVGKIEDRFAQYLQNTYD